MPKPLLHDQWTFPGHYVLVAALLITAFACGCRRGAPPSIQPAKMSVPDTEILAADDAHQEPVFQTSGSSWLEQTRSPEQIEYPLTWKHPESVAWSTEVDGRGHSSPLVVNDLLILTTADEELQRQMLVGLDRKTGLKRWAVTVHEKDFPASTLMHNDSSHASCTPVTDGAKVIAVFLQGNAIHVTAVSVTGEIHWQAVAGQFSPYMGYASSPVLVGGRVLVSADDGDGGFIASLDARDGRIQWRRKRAKGISHSSPVVGEIKGVIQILLSGLNRTVAYSLQTGDELWSAEGPAATTVGTVTVQDGLVFASGGYPEQGVICIEPKLNSSGWEAEVIWTAKQKIYVPTLLPTSFGLVGLTDNGMLLLWDQRTGEAIQRLRLGGEFFASPVLKNETIYVVSRGGDVRILQFHDRQLEIVGEVPMHGEVLATPAFSAGDAYFRIKRRTDAGYREFVECVRTMSPAVSEVTSK